MLHLSPTTNRAWFDEAICEGKDGACFQYISDTFPSLSEEKKTLGISDRPQNLSVNSRQKLDISRRRTLAIICVSVTKNFLGNTKVDNYVPLVNDVLEKLERLNEWWTGITNQQAEMINPTLSNDV